MDLFLHEGVCVGSSRAAAFRHVSGVHGPKQFLIALRIRYRHEGFCKFGFNASGAV